MNQLILGLVEMAYGLILIAISLAAPRWTRYLWAGWGKRNSVHARWYDEEIRPQIEADGDIGEIAHLALRAKLIERRREIGEAAGANHTTVADYDYWIVRN